MDCIHANGCRLRTWAGRQIRAELMGGDKSLKGKNREEWHPGQGRRAADRTPLRSTNAPSIDTKSATLPKVRTGLIQTMSCSTLIQMRNFRWVPLPASKRVCFHGNLCPFQVVSLVPHPPHLNFTRTGCLAMVV